MTIPTPILPIAILANATLTLRRELGTYTIDERSGNEIPDIETIEVSASLTKDLYQNRIAENVGADLQSIYLIGYILDPPDELANFELDGIAQLILNNFAPNKTLLGEFEFHYMPTPFGATIANIGIPIRGVYRVVENSIISGAKRLTGTIEATAEYSASISLTLFLSGISEAAAVLSGQLINIQQLVGTIAANGTYSGDLSIAITENLSGTIAATANQSGSLGITKLLSSAIAATSTISGAIGAVKSLTGTISASGDYAGDLTSVTTLSGIIEATANTAGDITAVKMLSGLVDSSGVNIGSLSIAKPLSGLLDAQASIEGEISTVKALSGLIESNATIAGVITLDKALTGAIAGSGDYAGLASITKLLSGTSEAIGSYAADLTAGGGLKGTIEIIGTYAGSTSVVKVLTGDIDTVGTFRATLATEKQLVGIIDCDATNNGSLSITKSLSGTIESSGVLAASPSVEKQLTGAIESTGTIVAALSTIKGLAGTIGSAGNYAANISTTKQLSGTIEVAGNFEGNLSTVGGLKGTIASTGSYTADLAIEKTLVGSSDATGTITGDLSIGVITALSGSISSTVTMSGFLSNGLAASLVIDGGSAVRTGDEAIYNRLRQLGFTTTYRSDSNSAISGQDLIIISQSVSGALVGNKYKTNASPVICLEPAIFDDMSMTGTVNNTDYGFTTGQTQISITNENHPLAAGLSSGLSTVYNSSGNIVWGVPNGNAITIATLASDSSKYAFFAYESGATMVDGTAVNKRVGFFIGSSNDEATLLSANGLQLLDAAIRWAAIAITHELTGTIAGMGTIAGDAATTKSLTGTVEASGVYSGNLTVESEGFEPSLDFSNADNSQYVPLL